MLGVMAAMPLSAHSIGEQLKQNTTFGGYVIGRVNATTNEDADVKADMGVRIARVHVDTKIGDFAMKLQMHLSGSPLNRKENSVRLVDAWVEWQHWKEFRVKFGQFKRCFTFENPMHPWNLGRGAYSQLTDRLAGYNDRTGEHASNGRDFGLQFQGDLFKSHHDGHRWLHYMAGVYTGQGINHADKNTQKDFIGGLWLMPIQNLQIGTFGWWGSYVRDDGTTINRRRYSFGINYSGDWTVRAEYAADHANGGADGWYCIVGTPAWHHAKLFAQYDVYREQRTFDNAHSIYGLSAQYSFHPNLMLQLNYGFHTNKTAADDKYHTIDMQCYWRF